MRPVGQLILSIHSATLYVRFLFPIDVAQMLRPKPQRPMSAFRHMSTAVKPGHLARTVAMFAMLLQVLFFAEHAGASAVRAMGHAAPGEKIGFLEICTGEGIVLIPVGSVPSSTTGPAQGQNHTSGSSSSSCAVCVSASVCGFDTPELTVSLALPFAAVHDLPSIDAPAAIVVLRLLSGGPIRAPPLLA